MTRFLRTAAARGTLAACAMLAAATPAHAAVLTFDDIAPTVLLGGESVGTGGFLWTALEGPYTAANGLHGASGAILDAADPGSCTALACPAGDSRYYAGLNDGGLHLARTDGRSFSLDRLDYAFLAGTPVEPGLAGQLVLTGTRAGGGAVLLRLDFPAQVAGGTFPVGSAALLPFTGISLSSLDISACVFAEGSCVNSLEQSAFNGAQFAIDNLGTTVSPVPEPAAWMSLLGGLAVLARRRKQVP
jgi:hypothetical protein